MAIPLQMSGMKERRNGEKRDKDRGMEGGVCVHATVSRQMEIDKQKVWCDKGQFGSARISLGVEGPNRGRLDVEYEIISWVDLMLGSEVLSIYRILDHQSME